MKSISSDELKETVGKLIAIENEYRQRSQDKSRVLLNRYYYQGRADSYAAVTNRLISEFLDELVITEQPPTIDVYSTKVGEE